MKEVRTIKRLFAIFLVVVLTLGLFVITSPQELLTTELFYVDSSWNFGWGTGPVGGDAFFSPSTTAWILSSIEVMADYTLLLIGTGLIGLAGFRRKFRR